MTYIKIRVVLVAFIFSTYALSPSVSAENWPKLQASDLSSCIREITELKQRSVAIQKKYAADEYCSKGDKNNCESQNRYASTIAQAEPTRWWMEGSGSCESPLFPCFGPDLFDEIYGGNLADIEEYAQRAAPNIIGPTDPDVTAATACISKAWLALYKKANEPVFNQVVEGSRKRIASGISSANSTTQGHSAERGKNLGEASNSGFLYDDLNHTQCIEQRKNGVSKRSFLLVNTCSEDLYVTFCSDDETRAGGMVNCPSLGAASIRANEEHVSRLWNDVGKIRVFKFACKEGWSPVEKGSDRSIYFNESATFRCRKLK